jgi:acyl-CoA synthetase (AMP-forming)/AMP-acid ligase II
MRLHDALDYHGRQRPVQPFALHAGRVLTYGEALAATNRLANALIAEGLRPGARVAFLARNCVEYPIVFYGCSKAGLVPVPLNYRLAPPEWSYIVHDAGAELLLARGELVGAIDAVRDELGTVRRCVALDAPTPAGWIDWQAWTAVQPATPPARDIEAGADCYQMYTSGTTGRPKGAVLTHAAVSANVSQLTLALLPPPGEKVLIVAPLYHAAATITALQAIAAAGTLVIHEDFDPAAVVRALSDEEVARTTLVPAMIQACLLIPDVARRRYDRLRLIVYGASPIAEQVLRRAMEVFGCEFRQGYGMTETTAVLTALMPDDHVRALREKPQLLLSAGRPLPGTEVRVVDADDRPLPPGQVGEIVGRGPQLMRGYWNLAEASAQALRGGWMHTGDAGYLDDEGFLYIQDRVKDMIVSGGENIYPREVEEVLFQHPAIGDAAVIGVPDEKFGEAVKAIVVLRQGASATPQGIMDFCKGRLGGYTRPRSVDFVDQLPRNPTGKVLKRQLREQYWFGHARRVS